MVQHLYGRITVRSRVRDELTWMLRGSISRCVFISRFYSMSCLLKVPSTIFAWQWILSLRHTCTVLEVILRQTLVTLKIYCCRVKRRQRTSRLQDHWMGLSVLSLYHYEHLISYPCRLCRHHQKVLPLYLEHQSKENGKHKCKVNESAYF